MLKPGTWKTSDFVIWLPLFSALAIVWWQMPFSGLANLFFIATVELFAIYWLLRLLTIHTPVKLLRLSEQNCHRQDGSLSKGRQRLEQKARQRLQRDYLATVCGVFVGLNAVALFVGSVLLSGTLELSFEHRCYAFATVFVLTMIFVWQWMRYSMTRSLEEFAAGIRRRAAEFATRDISRFEEDFHANLNPSSVANKR